MKALDFEYDSLLLSDFGCIICTFDGSGRNDVSIGSQLEFTTVSANFGKINHLTGSKYSECITSEFQICKNVDNLMDIETRHFSVEEQRDLMRWLNRPNFLPLKIIDEGYEFLCFNGSFNLTKIEISGYVVGFTLSLTTDRPFALNGDYVKKITITEADQTVSVQDVSDEIGYIYPSLKIVCKDSGTFSIVNNLDHRLMQIENCVSGEIITIDKNLMIETSDSEHSKTIMNDFNYVYLRISNTFVNRINKLKFSMPCEVTLSYSPIRKVGL